MRIRYCILTLVGLFVWGSGSAQEPVLDKLVTPTTTEGTIREILDDLEKQTHVQFFYDNSKIPVEKTKTISKGPKTVRRVLEELLKDENVRFIPKGRTIILKKEKDEVGKSDGKGTATIKGYINDGQSGENLIGAHVLTMEDFAGSTTNYYGFYSLTIPRGKVTWYFLIWVIKVKKWSLIYLETLQLTQRWQLHRWIWTKW